MTKIQPQRPATNASSPAPAQSKPAPRSPPPPRPFTATEFSTGKGSAHRAAALKIIGAQAGPKAGSTYVTPQGTDGVNVRADPPDGSILEVVRAPDQLRVTGSRVDGDDKRWLQVVTPDGKTGWVRADLVEESTGPQASYPWVLPAADGHPERTGKSDTAMAWARSYVGAGTGYADNCLGFVSQAHGVIQLPARCREMANPALFVSSADLIAADPLSSGHTDSAFAAYCALRETGKMNDVPANLADLPDGAILFYGPSTANGGEGHVCILQRNENGEMYVITSGWGDDPPQNQVQYIPLADMAELTEAPLLGYTTPEQAFSAETYPSLVVAS